jgi:hypothetical protein
MEVTRDSRDMDTIINGFTRQGVWFKPPSSSSRGNSSDFKINIFSRFVTPPLSWDMEKMYGAPKGLVDIWGWLGPLS